MCTWLTLAERNFEMMVLKDSRSIDPSKNVLRMAITSMMILLVVVVTAIMKENQEEEKNRFN